MDKKYQIFISSTFKDLIEVRREVARSVLRLTEIPAAMEDFGAVDTETMSYIKDVIDRCDYYVLLVAGRYGACDNTGVSYTEQEYDYALAKGKTILVSIRKNIDDLPLRDVDTDREAREKLDSFRSKVMGGRLVEFWDNPKQLYTSVAIALSNAFRTHPGTGWIRADAAEGFKFEEMDKIIKENENLKNRISELENKYGENYINNYLMNKMHQISVHWILYGKPYEHKIELSWAEIFKIFAPLVKRYVRPSWVREKFNDIVVSVIQGSRNGSDLAELSEIGYGQIESFFLGNELIEMRHDGGYYLTNIGKNLLNLYHK